MGWVTVALYLITSWQCLSVSRLLARMSDAPNAERSTWALFGIAFVALGLNKQLDLQAALTDIGRIVVTRVGLMAHKGTLQVAFITLVVSICCATIFALSRTLRCAHPAARVASLGATLVVAFVAIRAASFHHIDEFIGSTVLMVRWNWILEIGGIALVLIGSIWLRRSKVRPQFKK